MKNLTRVFCFLGAIAAMIGAIIFPHISTTMADGSIQRLIFPAIICFIGAVAVFAVLTFDDDEPGSFR
jgi:uncharacterized membrane protein YeaQ/YmgE (transglycosylase-associated protein family)